jgi:glutathione S-transferase
MLDGIAAFSERLHWHGRGQDNARDFESISFYNFSGKLKDEPSLVDFAVFPWIHRLYIIEHYCGFCLADASPEEVNDKIESWRQKMEILPAVRKTLAERKSLLEVYQRYADGSAQSKVGDAVRQGKDAHDI